ncbi:TonB-dependent siderophore receptor [Roseicella frigidaeris]|uniref:TonB-dependent siderophore receptor n=1 Tax=Roseicella frigidaeris TaxID=2230885 RepID=A0A327MHC0_9PROT|nr:TonB-dependent siderophore receptor [Roseicella frigidaeris]RAI59588.1 TonB-dependent siderophore receptor [Roseicella frigidaeris]
MRLAFFDRPPRAALVFALMPFAAVAEEASSSIELPTLEVQDQAERADGPVQGYRATRSATGTRTDTPLRDIPQSIAVVPRQVLEDQQAVSLDDALRNVSGVRPAGSAGNRSQSYILRGFRTQTQSVDGVMLNPALEFAETTRDLANVERVEVLKGPASVLYGRGDPGGVINIVTRRPDVRPSAGLNIMTGSYGFNRGEFDLTGPISADKSVTARLIGAAQQENGYRDHMSIAEREFLAPSLQWQPNDRTRVTLDATYLDQRLPFDRGLPAVGHAVTLPRERYFGENWSRASATRQDVALRIDHQATDWLTLRQVTHFDWATARRLSADPVSLAGPTLSRRATDQTDESQSIDLQLDATARFATGPLAHAVTLGGEYVHAKRSLELSQATLAPINIYMPIYGAQPGRFSLRTVRNNTLDLKSAFLQDQVAIGTQVKLLAGLRFDSYDQRDNSYNIITPSATQLNATNGSAWTPRFGAVCEPTSRLALYASWSRSFLPQVGADRIGRAFDPEKGEQYEAGIRYDIVPDRLTATFAAFHIIRENVLATDPQDSNYSVQTGKQRSRGFELDIAGEIMAGWRVIGSGAYTDAEITADTTFIPGRRLTGVPLWSGSVWSTYELQDGPLQGLLLGAGAFMAGPRAGDLNDSFKVSGYTRIDATVSYPVIPQARLALTARNLTDVRYIEMPVSRTENYAGAPRTIIASLAFRF